MYTQTVALRDVKCFAYHGFYSEEQLIGGDFIVDLEVEFSANEDTENLEKTVNYEVLNAIIQDEMKQTQKLLETVVKRLLAAVLLAYPFLIRAKASVKKINPPMRGEIGHSYVALSYKAD